MDRPRRLALLAAMFVALSGCGSISRQSAAELGSDSTLAPRSSASVPSPAPTFDLDAAGRRYSKITNAMLDSVDKAWVYGTRGISSLKQYKAYEVAVYAALSRWDKNLRSGKYPPEAKADLRILLQRLSSTLVLSYNVTQQNTARSAASYFDRTLKAWDSMIAAEEIVGKDLGLTYSP